MGNLYPFQKIPQILFHVSRIAVVPITIS